MRNYLFIKAAYFIEKKKIKIIAEGKHFIRFKVGDFETLLKYQNHELICLCSCRHGSENKICSHSIAAQVFLASPKAGLK